MSSWVFIHPADLVKTRMQLLEQNEKKTNAVSVAKDLVKNEGVQGLYAGLSAALARQASYTTLRLGLYDFMKRAVIDGFGKGKLHPLVARIGVGAVSGGIASFFSCPIEVCLVRMQADGKLPKDQQRGYRGVFHALYKIAKDEGVLAYWRGGGTTVTRAMVVSVSQIATYDQAKASLAPHLKGFLRHLVAGVISALTFTTASMPFDTVKTRMQQEKSGEKSRYKGMSDALVTIARTESVGTLWTGFPPYLLSKGTLTVILFLVKEQYTQLAIWLYSGGLKNLRV
ncbi:unnamed protein product [Ascophyllum nodosum]